MQISQIVQCQNFPCSDVRHEGYAVPAIDIDPASVSIVIISEAAAGNSSDNYYTGGEALFESTTLLAFQDAGVGVNTFQDILKLGVYFTKYRDCSGYG